MRAELTNYLRHIPFRIFRCRSQRCVRFDYLSSQWAAVQAQELCGRTQARSERHSRNRLLFRSACPATCCLGVISLPWGLRDPFCVDVCMCKWRPWACYCRQAVTCCCFHASQNTYCNYQIHQNTIKDQSTWHAIAYEQYVATAYESQLASLLAAVGFALANGYSAPGRTFTPHCGLKPRCIHLTGYDDET